MKALIATSFSSDLLVSAIALTSYRIASDYCRTVATANSRMAMSYSDNKLYRITSAGMCGIAYNTCEAHNYDQSGNG